MILDTLKEGEPLPLGFPVREAGAYGEGKLCQIGISQSLVQGAKYLPFAPKGINWISQGSSDVISYNFTGCIMAAFTHENIRKVCHVSTGTGQDCKEEWEKIKKASSSVSEFKPSDYIDTKGSAFVGCYGLITRDNHAYSITVVSKGGKKVISKIKSVHL